MSTMAAQGHPQAVSYVKERMSLPIFFVLLFAISWIGGAPMVLASYGVSIPGPLKLVQILMLMGPGIAACIAAYRNEGRPGVTGLLRKLVTWRVNPLLYVAVLAGPAVILALSLLISNAVGATQLKFPGFEKFLSGFAMTLGVYLLLNTEEIAWRGYALPKLQDRFGVFRATAIIAVLWLFFHLPLFWIKGGHPAGYPFWLFSLMIFSISLPFTWASNAARGSILIVHLLHQSLNAAAEALPVFPSFAHSMVPMLASTAIYGAISILLALRMRKTRTA